MTAEEPQKRLDNLEIRLEHAESVAALTVLKIKSLIEKIKNDKKECE
jgi:hypothetical protein